jgi:excisionase family DNA binding protein
MASDQVPVYVRLAAESAKRLNQAVTASGRSKRQLIEDAVRAHLSDDGFVVGRVELSENRPEILTLEEAAELLRLDREAMLAAAEAGQVPGRRIGEEWRFSRNALMNWLTAT